MSRFLLLAACLLLAAPAWAADTINVYTAWPESLSQPIFKAYTAQTGVQINFIRLSTGELVARATAEKNNPRADVIWGAPGDGFAAAKAAGILEPYKAASWGKIAPELKDPEGYYTAVSKNTLLFMSNAKLLKEKGLKAPTSWNDLLDPAYKGQIQTADARTSGTALTRILSIYYAFGKDEAKTLDYQKKLHANVQVYTKSGGGGTLPVGLGQAGGGIFFIVDALDTKAKGYDVVLSFPREGIGTSAEAIALLKGAKNPELGKKLIDWAASPAMQSLYAKHKINFVPANPEVKIEPGLAEVLKGAKIFPIDDAYAGANRKRVVQRWINEVLNAQ